MPTLTLAMMLALAGVARGGGAWEARLGAGGGKAQPSGAERRPSGEGAPLAALSPRERLEAMRVAERAQPVLGVTTAPEPVGYAESIAPLPDVSGEGAGDPLADVLDRYAGMAIDPPAPAASGEASPEDRFLAARLYVQAKSKMFDGDAGGAAEDLEHAVTLDPGAPSLWLALGEARLRAGREGDGIEAMRRVLALGLEHPRPLLLVSAWERSRGQMDAAIHHAVRAVRAPGMRDDAALRYLAWAALGDALRAGGLVRSAGEAYLRAFDLPEQFPAGTSYTSELSSMYRGSSDGLFLAARGAIAVGDWDLALRALTLAGRFQNVDDGRFLGPRVVAALRLGRPAEAALAIVDAIEQHAGATDPRTLRMIRFVRDHTGMGPALAAALTEIDSRVQGRSATIDAAMARAIAAGLPDGLDRGPLFDALRRHPADLGVAKDLLDSFGAEETPKGVDAAITAASANPALAQTVADAMLLSGLRTPRVLDMLRSSLDRPGAPLLLARLLVERGDFAQARTVLNSTDAGAGEDADLLAARAMCRVSVEALGGDASAARQVIDRWPTPGGDGQRLCLVRALTVVGDVPRARDAAGDPAGDSDASRALLLQACQLARAQNDAATAERLARRLVEVDPYSEPGYAVLIALYSPGGARADQPRMQQTVQALREHLPTGPLLRFLSAREFLQFGRLAEGDTRLRALALDAPDDENVLRSLLEVWARRAAGEDTSVLQQGESLLRGIAGEHPNSIGPAIAMAQLSISRERYEDVVPPIGVWLDRGLISTTDDRNRLRGVVEPLMRRATSSPDPRPRAALLALWGRMAGAGIPLDPPMHQARLVLLTQSPPFDQSAILDAVALAADEVPAMDPGAFLAPVGRLVQGGRADIGLALLRAGAARHNGLSSEDTTRWAGMIAQHGTPDDLRDLFRLTSSVETLGAMLPQLPAAPDEAPTDPARLRADIAYALAAATRVLDRPAEINEGFLALALEEFPRHESAANDLGYQWADRGVRLADAERLLLMAHEIQPDEANVLDSLGWLRYKQGRLSDAQDGAGGASGQGAVTLLERAASLLPEASGPVTLDQLGDALWRVGRHDDAVARWRAALPRAEQDVQRLESGDAPAGMRSDATSRRDSIRRKIEAADSGQDPPVAPLGEGVTIAR